MVNKIFVIIILLSPLWANGQGRVDGFYKSKGDIDLVANVGFEANPFYYAGRDKISLTRNILFTNFFMAYGISDKFNLNFSVPFLVVNGKEIGVQDLNLFFKYKLLSIKSTQISLASGFSSNITNYQTEGGSALGQQAKIVDVRIVTHSSFNKGYFSTFQIGYSFKSDPTPNSLPLALKVGLASSKYYVDFWYEYQYSFGGLDYLGIFVPISFKQLGVDYHKIGGTFYKPIKNKLGVFVGASYLIGGRNTSSGVSVNTGIVFKHIN